VQLGTISLIGQRCPPIIGEHGEQFQSRVGLEIVPLDVEIGEAALLALSR
jgi:hypothetical protein